MPIIVLSNFVVRQ